MSGNFKENGELTTFALLQANGKLWCKIHVYCNRVCLGIAINSTVYRAMDYYTRGTTRCKSFGDVFGLLRLCGINLEISDFSGIMQHFNV